MEKFSNFHTIGMEIGNSRYSSSTQLLKSLDISTKKSCVKKCAYYIVTFIFRRIRHSMTKFLYIVHVPDLE